MKIWTLKNLELYGIIIGTHSLFNFSLSLMCADNEGWFFGTSHNTGMSGLYPGNYVEKTKDSDCWTVHRYIHM